MPNKPRTFKVGPALRRKPRDNRPSPDKRGYDHAWKKFRAAYLAEHPFCVACEAEGRGPVEATQLDHRVPLTGPDDPTRLDPSAVDPLCAHHHSIKTSTRDGGFRGKGAR